MTAPLLIDVSPWSRQKPAAWADLAAAGAPWHGGIVKVSEGRTGYPAWFRAHWPAIRAAGHTKQREPERYGVDWARGGYHFAIADGRGTAQADVYCDEIDAAGGWGVGDLWPIIDVEEGSGNGARVARLGRSIVEDTVEAFADRVRRRTGRDVILYAGWWLRSIGVTTRLGCDWLWYAAYTRTLPAPWYQSIGWDVDRLLLWQYDGSGDSNGELPGYPTHAPIEHGEDVDINVLTLPGGLSALRSRLWAERPGDGLAGSCSSARRLPRS